MTRTTNDNGEPFGAWLLVRAGEPGPIGELAAAAKADRGFRPSGTPEDLRARLRVAMADGHMFAAVEDAEIDWLAY